MPAAVADPKRSLDLEQISPPTIAHHTVYEKTPNLYQSHICQWGAQLYVMGPLSRLVGKPPFSLWLSKNVLPSKKAANGPNSAISLTQTFDRILFCVYNSLYRPLLLRRPPKKPIFGFGRRKKKQSRLVTRLSRFFGGGKPKNIFAKSKTLFGANAMTRRRRKKKKKRGFSAWAPKNTTLS